MTVPGLDEIRAVQSAARAAVASLAASVTSADTERTIATRAVACLAAEGVSDTWYYSCPALVLLGARSCTSVYGRDYSPGDEAVGATNLVTVDLSPLAGSSIGDYARSLCVEGGRVVAQPATTAFCEGLALVASLHRHLLDTAGPDITFGALFASTNTLLDAAGFENLDLHGNLGHTLTAQLGERRFIEAGCELRLGDAGPFTFEPHVRSRDGRWGFKREDVYLLGDDGRAFVL